MPTTTSTAQGFDRLPVALDAMGGDDAPRQPVEGAARAVRHRGIPVALVGPSQELKSLVDGLGGPFDGLTFIDAPDVVRAEDEAVKAIRRKVRASVVVTMECVKVGRSRAAVSAGNSGAVVAAAVFMLGRTVGVQRPGIAVYAPTRSGGGVLLIDAGAIADPRPRYLVQHAYLASAYRRQIDGIDRPRVGLLNIGEEPGKGDQFTREAYGLLRAAPQLNFAGNVEGNTMLSGDVDVVVCGGFIGNVVLKTGEGAIQLLQERLRTELTRRWYLRLLAGALRPAFRRAGRRLDYREYGGAVLLGVQGTVIIAHGRSDSGAIERAIVAADRAAQSDVVAAMATAVPDGHIGSDEPALP